MGPVGGFIGFGAKLGPFLVVDLGARVVGATVGLGGGSAVEGAAGVAADVDGGGGGGGGGSFDVGGGGGGSLDGGGGGGSLDGGGGGVSASASRSRAGAKDFAFHAPFTGVTSTMTPNLSSQMRPPGNEIFCTTITVRLTEMGESSPLRTPWSSMYARALTVPFCWATTAMR
jgi:hypothetical protein